MPDLPSMILGVSRKTSEGPPIWKGEDRFKHLFAVGGTGFGKSTFLLNLIDKTDGGMIILDPNGSLAEQALRLKPGAWYVTKDHPIAINPLTINLPDDRIANELVEVINTAVRVTSPRQIDSTVLMQRITRNAIRTGIKDLKELQDFLEYEDRRAHVTDEYWVRFGERDKKGFYVNREQVESAKRIAARLSLLTEDKDAYAFLKGKHKMDLEVVAKNKLCIIFNFKRCDDFVTAFLGGLVAMCVKSYYQNKANYDSPPLYFFVDEAHLFFSELYGRFLAESRKYNISVNLAFHSLNQVDDKLLDMCWTNCHAKIFLGGNWQDAQIFGKAANYQMPQLKKHEGVVAIGSKAHHVMFYPPPELPEAPPQYNFMQEGWITA
jgi:type IV secretory pathway VirB4 component